MQMNNILNSYIPKFLVDLKKKNEEIITVSTRYFSPEGDIFELDTRALSPNLIQTTQSLQELQPEISTVFPFKIVTPIDFDGVTVIQSPSVNTEPTASQGYYAPIYFERYNAEVVRNINTQFTELTTGLVI